MTTTRICKTWASRIESGTFTKSQCQQWAAAVVPLSIGERPRGKDTVLTTEEATYLRMLMLVNNGVGLTDEHTAQGLAWMHRPKVADQFPSICLDQFSHFTFQGEGANVYPGDDSYNRRYYVPVWRIHTTGGFTLDYYATAWQSAAGFVGPTILHRSDPAAV